MSKNVNIAGQNIVNITGTVSQIDTREGTMKKTGKPYRSCRVTVRVDQTYGGKAEISEVPVDLFAAKFKKDGSLNPGYDNLNKLVTNYRSIAQAGVEGASRIQFSGKSCHVNENLFVSPNNPENVVSSWRISSMYFNEARTPNDSATFGMDIYIMSIDRELNAGGEETGRLKITGCYVNNRGPGSAAFGEVLTFYVERAETIDYIERNWEINTTQYVEGRIRYCVEEVQYHTENTWGEDIPKASTRARHELIITNVNPFPYEEEMSYSTEDIQVLIADRKARKQQLLNDAAQPKAAPKKASVVGMDWDE